MISNVSVDISYNDRADKGIRNGDFTPYTECVGIGSISLGRAGMLHNYLSVPASRFARVPASRFARCVPASPVESDHPAGCDGRGGRGHQEL